MSRLICKCPAGWPQIREWRISNLYSYRLPRSFGNPGVVLKVHTGECPLSDEHVSFLLATSEEGN